MNSYISVIVSSCDKYSFLWSDFHKLFSKYWKLETNNFFISEDRVFDYDNFTSITAGKVEWGKRISTTLDEIKTDYVFFILEDYFFYTQIHESFIMNNV